MSDALRRKRERQARRVLRVSVQEFRTSCLEEYVDAFEADALEQMSNQNCALGTMSRGDGRCEYAQDMRSLHGRAARHVENIFEGWALFHGLPLWMKVDSHTTATWNDSLGESKRRRLIYEACVEELARRNSESVLSPEARVVEVAP